MTAIQEIKNEQKALRMKGQQAMTDEQVDYVYQREKDLLVSASAGAGKTFSTVQRILGLLRDGHSIDQLFVSTFTVKAANELKDRIDRAIRDLARKEESPLVRKHLLAQLPLLETADIGTMDAFANKVVAEYGFRRNLPMSYRVLQEESERDILMNEAFSRVLEQFSDRPGFQELVANYTQGSKTIQAFREVVFSVYRFAQSSPDPDQWLTEKAFQPALYEETITEAFLESMTASLEAELLAEKKRVGSERDFFLRLLEKKKVTTFIQTFQSYGISKRASIDDPEFRQAVQELHANFIEPFQNIEVDLSQLPSSTYEVCQSAVRLIQQTPAKQTSKGQPTAAAKRLESIRRQGDRILEDLERQDLSSLLSASRFIKTSDWKEVPGLSQEFKDFIDRSKGAELTLDDVSPNHLSDAKRAVQVIFASLSAQVAACSLPPVQGTLAQYVTQSQDQIFPPLKTMVTSAFFKQHFKHLQEALEEFALSDFLDPRDKAKRILPLLVEVVQAFQTIYKDIKRKNGLLEFSDIAHEAIALLKADEGEIARVYQARYIEVMVDEYQDNSQIQEELLNILSGKLQELQAQDGQGQPSWIARSSVGDIKQSIYGFRQADPAIFRGTMQSYEKDTSGQEMVVRLKENFRSSKEVIDATNAVFSRLMDQELGGIDYNQDQTLTQLAHSPKTVPHPEWKAEYLIFDRSQDQEGEEAPEEVISQGQLDLVIEEILQLKETRADLQYQDICLLVSGRTHNKAVMDAFEHYGIPLVSDDGEAHYLDSMEIINMIQALKVIENPLDDPALFAWMHSPMFQFSDDELARISLQSASGPLFYQKLQAIQSEAVQTHDLILPELQHKIQDFLDLLTDYQSYARTHSVYDLIWRIYDERFYMAYAKALDHHDGGTQRQANLLAFAKRAESFESSGYKGLTRFIAMMDKLLASDHDLADEQTEMPTDAVRLMTIHKSKGLEFKVVFVLNMQSQFNLSDVRTSVVLDVEGGIGSKITLDAKAALQQSDEELPHFLPTVQTVLETVPYKRNAEALRRSLLAERMRVLYVAMTRAEEKLYLVGEGDSSKWGNQTNSLELVEKESILGSGEVEKMRLLPLEERLKARSFQDWLLDLYAADPTLEEDLQLTFKKANRDILSQQLARKEDLRPADSRLKDLRQNDETTALLNRLKRVSTYNQERQAAISLPSVRTPSQLEEQKEPEKEEGLARSESYPADVFRPIFRLFQPEDVTGQKKLTRAEIGTWTHRLMERIPLEETVTIDTLQDLALSMLENPGYLLDLPLRQIVEFFNDTELGQRLRQHPENVYREVTFSMIDTHTIKVENGRKEENYDAIIRGIVDGYYWDRTDPSQPILLFDYKINHFQTEADVDRIRKQYASQQDHYARALRAATQTPVQKYLILLGGEHVRVEELPDDDSL